jgi:hypothetical protein
MKAIAFITFVFYLLTQLDSCGPTITVSNRTTIPVRVVVFNAGRSDTLSPSPGESSSTEAQDGAWVVTVIPDAEWIAYAQLVRNDLNQQIANSDRLTGPQLLDVVRRLKDIAARMQQYQQAAGSSAKCGGLINSSAGSSTGFATVSVGANGALSVACK